MTVDSGVSITVVCAIAVVAIRLAAAIWPPTSRALNGVFSIVRLLLSLWRHNAHPGPQGSLTADQTGIAVVRNTVRRAKLECIWATPGRRDRC